MDDETKVILKNESPISKELKDVSKIHADFRGEFYHDSITFANPTTFQIWIKLQLSYNNVRKYE